MNKPSPRAQLIFGVLVSLAFLGWAFHGIDIGELLGHMRRAELTFSLPILIALLFASFWLRALRWTFILRPAGRFRTAEVFPAVMIGFMGNNIYPAHLGEFLRAYAFSRQKSLPFATVFSTLVVERVFDVFAILSCFYGAIALLGDQAIPEVLRKGALGMGIVTGIGVLGLMPAAYAPDFTGRIVEAVASRLPERLGALLRSLYEGVSQGLAVARSPLLLIACLLTSYGVWILIGIMAVVALGAFGAEVTMPQAMFLQGALAFAVTIPSSPGFFGAIQVAFKLVLGLFGVDETLALAASWYYHLVQYVPVTVVGLYYLKVLNVEVDAARAMREGETDDDADGGSDDAVDDSAADDDAADVDSTDADSTDADSTDADSTDADSTDADSTDEAETAGETPRASLTADSSATKAAETTDPAPASKPGTDADSPVATEDEAERRTDASS